jgi:hypothetical protein
VPEHIFGDKGAKRREGPKSERGRECVLYTQIATIHRVIILIEYSIHYRAYVNTRISKMNDKKYYISLEEFNSNLEQRINKDINDLEVITPTMDPTRNNFYIYPLITDLLINRNGVIIRKSTDRILLSYPKGRGYLTVKHPEGGKLRDCRVHRLLAITFIGRPSRHANTPYDKLHVNHINGKHSDNRLVNLEWCDYKENIQHASDNCLLYTVAILAKHLITNTIIKFKSIKSCSSYFNINANTFQNMFSRNGECRGFKDNYIFKRDDDKDWRIFPNEEMYELGKNNYHEVMLVDINTNYKIIFGTIVEAANYINISNSALGGYVDSDKIIPGTNYKCVSI